jgi:hypothetical protein
MAKAQKYDTIEEVAAAMNVEINDKTRSFLEAFVKKAPGEAAGAKRKDLLKEAELFGVQGLDPDNENIGTLQIKIIGFLFDNARLDEMKEFAAKHKLFVTDTGAIHHIKQAVKSIEQRNAGVKEGSVGYNTIQLLKEEEYAGCTAAELVQKLAEIFEQETTPACIQWYINYCHKKKEAAEKAKAEAIATAEAAGEVLEPDKVLAFDTTIENFTIAERTRAIRTKTVAGTGVALGAQLTMEKATKPKGFKKKPAVAGTAELGAPLKLDGEETEDGTEA